MKNLVIAMVIVLGLVGTVSAQDKLEATTQMDFFSKYIWRGQNFTDGPVSQPSVNLSYKRFTLSVWGNLELDNVNNSRWDITETDITLDYTNYLLGHDVIEYSFTKLIPNIKSSLPDFPILPKSLSNKFT